jgi:hypothetical protein
VIKLDVLDLPDNDGNGIGALQWVDRVSGAVSLVSHDARRTSAGVYRYAQSARSGGRPITLSTSTTTGKLAALLTTAQVDSLVALASAPGDHVLSLGGVSMRVIFRQAEQPVLELVEIHPGAGKWAGSIKLETV